MRKNVIGKCILCHRDGQVMSDEHVIPDAIGGHYHIYTICRDCNSKLGYKVDRHLLDNWVTIAKREEYKLAGHSGTIPHPLTGNGVLEDGQRVKVELDDDGSLSTHIIPTAPIVSEDGRQILFAVDGKDAKGIDRIVNAIVKRKGIDPTKCKIESTRTDVKIEQPCVQMQFKIDTKAYILSLLKIAYEFTVDKCPRYIDDPIAKLYAEILLQADVNRIDEVKVLSNFFMDKTFEILPLFIENTPQRHILCLREHEGKLICGIKLFDAYGISILMSENSYGLDNQNGIVTVNDIKENRCDFYTIGKLISKTLYGTNRVFIFDEEGSNILASAQSNLTELEFGFASNKFGQNILFDANGNAVITEDKLLMELELQSDEAPVITGEGYEQTYNYPDGLYYLIPATEQLVPAKGLKETVILKKI